MKVLNFNSAYPADGKSVLIRLIANDLKNLSKKVLIFDNSEQSSGFRKMYDLEEAVGIDAMRPFIKGGILNIDQLNEICIHLEENIAYIANSEIDQMEDEDIFFMLKLLERSYDYVLIEGSNSIKSSEFNIQNYYITRPCEKILKNIQKLSEEYKIIVNKEFEELNMNYKKLGLFPFSYDKEVVLMENGYNHNISEINRKQLKSITNDILGFDYDEISTKNNKKERFNILKNIIFFRR